MRTLIVLLVPAHPFEGYAVDTPTGSLVVDPAGLHDSTAGKFCPPGQGKKSNC